jgi:outer membrane protein TolC
MTQMTNTALPVGVVFAARKDNRLRPLWIVCACLLSATAACQKFTAVTGSGAAVEVMQGNGSAGPEKLSEIKTNPLPLTDAVRLGVLKSNGVALAQIARAKSETEIKVSQAAYWPEVFVGLSPSGADGTIAAASAGVRYTLFAFGARAAQVNASKAQQKAAESDVINATNASVAMVLEKYINVSVNEAIAVAAREYSGRIDDLGASIESRVNSGASSPADLNEIKVGALRAEAAVLNADADSANAKVELMSVTGLAPQSVQSAQSLQGLLALGEGDQTKTPDFAQFPQIRALDQTVLAAEAQLKAAKSGRIPRVNLEASAGFDITNSGATTEAGTRFGPSISNVFGLGGGNAARVSGALLDVTAAQTRRAEELRRLNELYLLAQNDISRAISNESKRRAIYDETAKMLDIFTAEYQGGSRDLSEVVSVQDRLFQGRVDALNAMRDLLLAKMRFLIATNQLADRVYQKPNVQ